MFIWIPIHLAYHKMPARLAAKASKTMKPTATSLPVSARSSFSKTYHLPKSHRYIQMNIFDQSKIEAKRSEAVREEERDEVLWTSECSPRVAGVRRGQDARLQCEVVAPTGSVLTWYKDGVSLNREGAQVEVGSTPQELLEEATNMLGLEEELSSTASTSASVLQISSVVYLDCVSNQHQATYKLEVRAPRSQKSYSRLFTVVIVGDESETLEEGPTCRLGGLVNASASHLPTLPRGHGSCRGLRDVALSLAGSQRHSGMVPQR
ncbi:uncharacterized protein LOC119587360 [Penaeus monodon]|uniref:uncharacterized protein LOC119587360 n=1 Tax=Penaeus monodon TaxID=6687 RepID=UPI0018A75987|nr:uncharacterized protein LOC119587360 [Penaeus monodon]